MAADAAAFVSLALDLAAVSAVVIRRHFRTGVPVDDKADQSPVTIADRDSEAAMRDLIARVAPDHGVIGEEHGSDKADAEWVWVLDPIDGTGAFVTGKPSFGTLIGLCHRGRPVLGVLNQPVLRECWIGGEGVPATLNGRPLHTRACPSVERAALFCTTPDMFEGADAQAFGRLKQAAKLVRYGADCYAYGLVAAGHADLVCESSLKLHDYAALAPLMIAAGGVMTDWQGQPLGMGSGDKVLAAGDAACHARGLALLNG